MARHRKALIESLFKSATLETRKLQLWAVYELDYGSQAKAAKIEKVRQRMLCRKASTNP